MSCILLLRGDVPVCAIHKKRVTQSILPHVDLSGLILIGISKCIACSYAILIISASLLWVARDSIGPVAILPEPSARIVQQILLRVLYRYIIPVITFSFNLQHWLWLVVLHLFRNIGRLRRYMDQRSLNSSFMPSSLLNSIAATHCYRAYHHPSSAAYNAFKTQLQGSSPVQQDIIT